MAAINRNIDNSWTGTGRIVDEAMKNVSDSLEGIFSGKDWMFKNVEPVTNIDIKNNSNINSRVEDTIIITVYINVSKLNNNSILPTIKYYNDMYSTAIVGSNAYVIVVPVEKDMPIEVRVISHNSDTVSLEENHNDNKRSTKRV